MFYIVLIILLVLCAVETCYISADSQEVTFFTKDSVISNILVLFGFVAVLFFISKFRIIRILIERIESNSTAFRIIKGTMLIALLCIALLWIVLVPVNPEGDQYLVQDAAVQIANGNTEPFSLEGGYISRYPGQLGLMWFSFLLGKVFGYYNYRVFQIFNALAFTLDYWSLSAICADFGCFPTAHFLKFPKCDSFVYLVDGNNKYLDYCTKLAD